MPIWNDFFFPLVLLRSCEKATIPVGLTSFFGQFQTDWAVLFAGLVVATVPLVLLFLFATNADHRRADSRYGQVAVRVWAGTGRRAAG